MRLRARLLVRASLACALIVMSSSVILAIATSIQSVPAFTSVGTIVGGSSLKRPAGVAVDPASGNLFVADTKNHRIKVVTLSGTVSLLAGSGKPGQADGTGATSEFHEPAGLAYDRTEGVLYVADRHNHLIRKISAGGAVSRVAGTGKRGFTDGPSFAAQFDEPAAIAIGSDGALYVADSKNSAIRKITRDGIVSTIAGDGRRGSADGPASVSRLAEPEGIAVGSNGTIYVADTWNHRIRVITDGVVSTVAGSVAGYANGAGAVAQFNAPRGIVLDDNGDLFVVDGGNAVIRKITIATGTVSTVAGAVQRKENPPLNDGPLDAATFDDPSGAAFAGALYIADSRHDAIRVLRPFVQVGAVEPARGPVAGGNELRISGSGFAPGNVQVSIGGGAAPAITYISSTELTVIAPAHVAGVVDLFVSTTFGDAALENAYTYLDPPTITAIQPQKGRTEGGQITTITGTEFIEGDTEFRFGSATATAATVETPDTATVTAPPRAAGTVDVAVKTPGGEALLPAAFKYLAPPVIAGFGPQSGFPETSVAIAGENFDPVVNDNTVRFAGVAAPVLAATPTEIITSVPQGAVTGPITVATAGGDATSATSFVVPALTSIAVTPSTTTLAIGGEAQLVAGGLYSDGTVRDLSASVTWTSSNVSVATVNATGLVTAAGDGTAEIDATLAAITGSASIEVVSLDLPPDPASVAPPLDLSVSTSFAGSTAFLYTGENPIQRDVAPDAIESHRVAVLRGRATTRDGAPLPGVRVSVAGSAVLGWTLTRTDGAFDLAVNGGGPLTIVFSKDGYLPVHRQVVPQWNRFSIVPPVALVQLDPRVTVIDSDATTMQVARGSEVTDDDGTRTATLLFPAGTEATMTLPDGTSQPLQSLHVRATEYSVGEHGPAAMPALLPPQTAYTYCAELSVDEAIASGATRVEFSKPVILYVDNFLDFPVGEIVPAGYYDRATQLWMPAENGVVAKVLSVDGGEAALDLDGDGLPETAAILEQKGITTEERQRLGGLYTAGATLWRAMVDHFTPVDLNWAGLPVGAAQPPAEAGPEEEINPDDVCRISGSIIECQSQTLGESIPITGTGFQLEYRSSRVPGRLSARNLEVRLSGDGVPEAASEILVSVNIAGQELQRHFAPAENLRTSFLWNGADVYGRTVQGAQIAEVKITYVYPADYSRTERFLTNPQGLRLAPARGAYEWTTDHALWLRPWDARSAGLGGWLLDTHQFIDVGGQILYRGDGGKRTASDPAGVVRTVAGTGPCSGSCPATNGSTATATQLGGTPRGVAVAADGTTYFTSGSEISRLDPGGRWWRVAGQRSNNDPQGRGDGGPAVNAGLYDSYGIAVGPDGSIYFSELSPSRIRKIDPNGMITRYAGVGDGVAGFSGDGGPATAAKFRSITDLAADRNGNLYLVDSGNRRVRRIDPDGRITTVAGDGTALPFDGSVTDNVPATSTPASPVSIAVGPDGTLYMVESGTRGRVRSVRPDGIIRTVAEPVCTSSNCAGSVAIAVDFDGTIFASTIVSFPERKLTIRRIAPDGTTTVVAAGSDGFGGDGGMATNAAYSTPLDMAVSPDGALVVADTSNWRVRAVTQPLGIKQGEQILVPDGQGQTVAIFNEEGRHLRTVDALTNTPLLTFSYDDQGRLGTVTDTYGNQTRIERDVNGGVAILAPGGQRTTLAFDDAGYLSGITNAAGEKVTLTMTGEGLLTDLRQPGGANYHFQYSSLGRLETDSDPAGGAKNLSVVRTDDDVRVTTTTALGRTTQYFDDVLEGADVRRTTTAPDGTTSITLKERRAVTTTTSADGTKFTTTTSGDPRFGTLAPLASSWSMRTPAGRLLSGSLTRTVTLGTATDPLSLTAVTDTIKVNGRNYVSTYLSPTRQVTSTTPAGRSAVASLNLQGEIVSIQAGGLTPLTYSYDEIGRLETVSRAGARATTFGYDDRHRVTRISDSLGRAVGFAYDENDRVISQTLPDERVIGFAYDENGNLISVTPPGRPAHTFSHTPVDLVDRYDGAGAVTRYVYNADRQLTNVVRGDEGIDLTYESTGRLSTVTFGSHAVSYGYSGKGQLESATTSGQSLNYTFDGVLLTAVALTGEVAGTVGYTYNNDFRVTSEAVGGAGISLAYDSDGLLRTAGALTLTRDPQHGLVTATTLASARDDYGYNSLGELATYTAKYGATQLLSFTYMRDAAGRIVSDGSRGFEYDPSGRLIRVTSGGTAIAEYDYDSNGNRIAHRWLGGNTAATYDGQDRLLTYGDASYEYNANGDLKSKTVAGATTSYSYDAVGNLRSVLLPNSVAIEYVIDGQNRRVGKRVNGMLTQGFLYSGQLRIVAELNGANQVVSRFVYGSRTNVPDYMIKSGVTYRIFSDHLGSPRIVVNTSNGVIVQRIEYDVFGAVMSDTNPGFQPFGFAGGLHDRDTALVRFGTRDYDPHTGRFVSKDPIGFSGGDTNLYAYVLNDPINLIDPMGTDWVEAMEPAGNFFAGMGDTLSFGLTTRFNEWTGASAVVDKCSGAFSGGELFGTGVSLAFGASHLGRNAAKLGLRRLAYDNRVWGTVRRAWSGRPPTLRNTGRSLHHWLLPQRASEVPQGVLNAGFNYFPISAGFNSWMNGSTFTRTAVEYGVKGVVGGVYGGLLGGGSGSDGCGCQ